MSALSLAAPKLPVDDSRPRDARDTGSPIDFSKLFIAEELTPLFHTAAYAALPANVRLRYNQLHAFYFNEQVTFFEQEMLSPALLALLDGPLPSGLAEAVRTFFEEEQRHTARFREINHRCAPDLYTGSPYHFVRLSPALTRLLHAVSAHPRRFPLIIWIAMLQEERSLSYSKSCLGCAGELEPHFFSTHRAHLADEIGHVGWDEELLDWLWPRTGPATRQVNARLLEWMIGEFFYLPKRSALRVIEQLVGEYPHLDARKLSGAVRSLRHHPAYLRTLYSREITPRTFAHFDAHPEFVLLGRTLAGYRRPDLSL
jgi:hypothetical protein